MIAECAVDPEVFADWSHFHSLHGDFGVGHGRLLCEFPGKWRRQVLQAAQRLEREGRNTAIQTQRIIDHFQQESFRRALVSSGRRFQEGCGWKDAARSTERPFDLIIHGDAPASDREVRCGEFIKTEPPFRRIRQMEVKRTAAELIACGWQCFSRSTEIIVVDPYFRPNDADFGKVLGHFLARLEREARQPNRLEVHTSLPRPYDPELQQRNWNRWATEHLPSGWILKVIHWQTLESGGSLHARYILTDFGGLDYNWGTDEDPSEMTQVALLDDQFWKQLHDRFVWSDDKIPKDFQCFPQRVLKITG